MDKEISLQSYFKNSYRIVQQQLCEQSVAINIQPTKIAFLPSSQNKNSNSMMTQMMVSTF